MNKDILAKFFKNAQATLSKRSPEILTGIGIAGMLGTTVMAVKATPKALKLIEEKKKEDNVEKLSPVDVVKTTWKCYIPAAVTGVTSTACLIKATSINTRRNAALVTAYNLSKTALDEYKDKVVETIGEKKEKLIQDSIAKDKLDENPVENHEVFVTDKGTTRCFDGFSGRRFISSRDAIERAINRLNRSMVTNMYVSLNEFYRELDICPVDMGDVLGWNFDDGEIEVYFSAQVDTDGVPCLVVSYNVAPKYDFSKII